MGSQQSCSSDWPDLPAPLLQTAFRSQLNPLDNCAAACTCRAWRAAVSSVPIAELHLHLRLEGHWRCYETTLATRIRQWSSFLASRRPLRHLKLTTDKEHHLDRRTKVADTLEAELRIIARSSTSLSMTQLFMDMLHHFCTDELATIQHLSVISNGLNQEPLPNLSHCSSLKSVKLIFWDSDYCKAAEDFVPKFPEALQTLCIQGAECRSHRPEYTASGLANKLQHLRHLELQYCTLSFSVESLMSFGRLDSLSLAGSSVCSWGDIRMLTNLKRLKVRRCKWGFTEYQSRPAWTKFRAWPALQLLDFTMCNLVDRSTMLDVACVSEVHTHFMVASLEPVKVHLYDRDTICPEGLSSASFTHYNWCTCLVELQLTARRGTASQLFSLLHQLLGRCALRILGVTACTQECDSHEQPLQFLCSEASRLRELQLRGLCCETINLSLSGITHLAIWNVDLPASPCNIHFSTTLESLDFCGYSLFCLGSETCLQQLPALSYLTLRLPSWKGSTATQRQYNAVVPTLPATLHHLRILDTRLWNRLDRQFETCLRFCSNLQHLTLPPNTDLPSSNINAWARASCIHVIDGIDDLHPVNLQFWFSDDFHMMRLF
ncbi:hypothetical protein ABBQ32_14125 [Trebouxia sp. C0010 RCD-2024]